jgi:hypothetical protein
VISSLALQYTRWLYDRVCIVRDYDSPRSYIKLCGEMQDMLFRVIVPLDENRRLDGRDLRDEFLDYIQDRKLDREVERAHEVTLLETFVGLAARGRLLTGMEEYQWFEIFLNNLGLDGCGDRTFDVITRQRARRILRKFNDRRYRANGLGGLFPLSMPLCDQREAELWSQLGAYIREHYLD